MKEEDTIALAHGSGGQMSRELVEQVFAKAFANPILASMGDAAVLEPPAGGRLALTTDSFVVRPLVFPGGDIGKLSICGTVNDLAVSGAEPLYLSAAFILEEGFSRSLLVELVESMAATAKTAGVRIVTGDTKVVERHAADGLFINTTGVGWIPAGRMLGPERLQPGDVILVNGTLGDHGLAVMLQREGMVFESKLTSDCAPLNGLIAALLAAVPEGAVRCMRDPTRGGVAATLNEWVEGGAGIELEEGVLPIREEVAAACEILGLDPLQAANEGKVVIAVAAEYAETALATLRLHPLGRQAAAIGKVTAEHSGRVVLRTVYGARRIIEMPVGLLLPRIC